MAVIGVRSFVLLSACALLTACGGGGGSSAAPVPTVTPTPGPTPNTLSVPSLPGASTVIFSGYTWNVRSDNGGPGPNQFSASNVWIDSTGFLHLKITDTNGVWTTAEVVMNQNLGFGTYQFQILGHPETMDNNVVLGLFNYTLPSVGPDGTNEIDIEFATWAGAQTQHGNWTVWPAVAGPPQATNPFDASPNTGQSTHRFHWESTSVTFSALSGIASPQQYATWTYSPANSSQLIPQTPIPVHMNLWLFNGLPPTNGQGVEMIITGFSFTPG